MITKPRLHPAQSALRRIVADVSSIIPRDLKGDKYWHMTTEAHDRFVDAVRACERVDSQHTRDEVRRTGAEWKESWRKAIAVWVADHRAGRHPVGIEARERGDIVIGVQPRR